MSLVTKDSAYAYVAAMTFVAFLAYGVFTSVTVLNFSKGGANPEIVVLSEALAKSEAMQVCFMLYAFFDLAQRLAWEIGYSRFSTASQGAAWKWLRYARAIAFVSNPVWQLFVGGFKMTENSEVHYGFAITVVAAFIVYLILSIIIHITDSCQNGSAVAGVGIAVEVVSLAVTFVGMLCFGLSQCAMSTNVVTNAWYEYVTYTFVALMGTVRALDIAIAPADGKVYDGV